MMVLAKENKGYSRVKVSLRSKRIEGKCLTPTQVEMAAFIGSCHKKGKGCKLPHAQMKEVFDKSSATVSRAINRLKDAKLVEQVDRDARGVSYKSLHVAGKEEYDIIPHELYRRKFLVNGREEKMRASARTLMGRIMRIALSNHHVKEICFDKTLTEGYRRDCLAKAELLYTKESNGKLARELNLSTKTLHKAFKWLCDAKVLECTKEGVNGSIYSVYEILDKSVYEYLFYEPPKKESKKTPEQTRIEAADYRAEREHWYAERRRKAERPVEKVKERLDKLPEWKENKRELANIGPEYGRASLAKDASKLAALREREKKLLARRTYLLRQQGLTEEELVVKYHCSICSDSGVMPSGFACNCYKQRE